MFGYRGDGGDLVIQEEVTVIDQEDENQVDGGCDFRLLHPVTSIIMSNNVEKMTAIFIFRTTICIKLSSRKI